MPGIRARLIGASGRRVESDGDLARERLIGDACRR
jgi:hypothetical protein